MGFISFIIDHQWVFLFYAIVITVIILLRKKIEWQAFGIGLYKTKAGLKLMDKWGKKHRGIFQLIGYIGIGVAFIGMMYISGILVHGVWELFANPAAPAVISPVVPGFSVPGTDLKVPLVTGWIVLFCVIVIHEFMHGVISRAHDVPVKSSGLLIFGPLGGAFVEPDEKILQKKDPVMQYSMFAAGPFSNIVTGLIFMLITAFIILPIIGAMTMPAGVEVISVTPNYPAANASLNSGIVISKIDGVAITDVESFSKQFESVRPGDSVILSSSSSSGSAGRDYNLTAMQSPNNSSKALIGMNFKTKQDPVISGMLFGALVSVMLWVKDFFYWLFLLSLGLGLANLLPLGPVDGGRMVQLAARQITGDKKRGDWWWKWISITTLVIVLVLLVASFIK